MSGFALAYEESGSRPLSGMLAAIKHRGTAVQTRGHNSLEWGICNRTTEAHFKAQLGGTVGTSVLVEGWVDNAGEFIKSAGCATLPDAIAASVEREGVESLARLRGGFVVALFDQASRRLSLFRDTQGLRPAHYFCDGNTLVAASEVKAVLAHPAVPCAIDTTVLAHLLIDGLEPEDRSLALGVHKVRPGHLIVFDPGSAAASRQLVAPFLPTRDLTVREAVDELQQCLEAGLRQRVQDLSSVSVLLSSGVDSFLVAKTLTDIDAPVRAATAAVSGDPENEVVPAREAARHLGIQHDSWEVSSEGNLLDLLRKAVTATEQPGRFGNALLLMNMFEQWGDGPKVVGSGESADTMFGAYSYRVMRRARLVRRVLMGGIGVRLLRPFSELFGPRIGRALDLAQRTPWDHRYFVAEVFDCDCVSRLMGIDAVDMITKYYADAWQETNGAPEEQRFMYVDLRNATQGCIDKKEKIAASAGIDVIHPFLMPAVCDLGFSLPIGLKIRDDDDKLVPSAIAHGSYPPLQQRDKIGFSVPRTSWLQTNLGLRAAVDGLADSSARVGDYVDRAELKAMVAGFNSSGGIRFSDTLWILTSVELWCGGLGI